MTVICACVLAQVIVEQIAISPLYWAFLSGIILWWFGSRQGIILTIHKGGKKDE